MDVEGCQLPEDLLYDEGNDVWVRPPEGEGGAATLGVISALASFAGRFTAIGYRTLEGLVPAGRSIATLESVRLTGPVRLPVAGTIVGRNPALAARPRMVNDDAYGAGWIARFQPADPTGWRDHLETALAISERLRARIQRLRIRCYPAIPDVELYEIGAECSAILARVDDELRGRAANDVLLLVTDDPTSPIEMVRWSDRTGHTVLGDRVEDELHHFLIRKEGNPVPRPRRWG